MDTGSTKNPDESTTMKVKRDTWKQLNKQKEPGDTFDDVIGRLIEQTSGNPTRMTPPTAD